MEIASLVFYKALFKQAHNTYYELDYRIASNKRPPSF